VACIKLTVKDVMEAESSSIVGFRLSGTTLPSSFITAVNVIKAFLDTIVSFRCSNEKDKFLWTLSYVCINILQHK